MRETYSALSQVGPGPALSVGAFSKHSLAVIPTGAPAVLTVRLEGSLDNMHWFDLSGAQDCSTDTMFHVVDKHVAFVRPFVVALSGGSSPAAMITYLGDR